MIFHDNIYVVKTFLLRIHNIFLMTISISTLHIISVDENFHKKPIKYSVNIRKLLLIYKYHMIFFIIT